MLRKAATIRYVSYVLGTGLTLANLFLITYLLDIYQFAVWGVANSLVYIFSQIGQLTYVQYIEKYFPNYSIEKMNYYLYKFLKTISLLPILWISILFLLEYFGYFEKFNADNLIILFLIIAGLTTVESSIELSAKYLLAQKETPKFDLYELLLFKLTRLAIFYFLLANGYSVYFLLLTNLILRSLLLIKTLNYKSQGVLKILKKIFRSKIFEKNLDKLSYTFTAFMIKTMQVTFLNVLFIILSISAKNETIANYSLGILIINNLRPVFASLSGLLTPIISKNIYGNKDNATLFSFVASINRIFISLVTVLTIYIVDYKFLISYFLESFDENIYTIILVSVFASSIASLYIPNFLNLLFSNKEKYLLQIVLVNFIFCMFLFYILRETSFIDLLYIYLLFETISFYIFKYMNNLTSFTTANTYSFVATLIYLATYLSGYGTSFLLLFVWIIFIGYDIKKFIKQFNNYDSIKDKDYGTK